MSSSSSSSRQTTTYNTETYDLSGLDGGQAVAGTNNTVTFSDQGAIEAGRDVAKTAIEANTENNANALSFARDVQSSSTSAVRKTNQRLEKTARKAMDEVAKAQEPADQQVSETVIWAAGGVAVVAVVASMWGRA